MPRSFDRIQIVGSLVAIAAFVALVALARHRIPQLATDDPQRLLLALAPAVPMLTGIGLEIRYLLRLDELQLRIAIGALVAGSYCGISVGLVAFLLEELAGVPRLSPAVICGVFGVATWLGWLLARLRYR